MGHMCFSVKKKILVISESLWLHKFKFGSHTLEVKCGTLDHSCLTSGKRIMLFTKIGKLKVEIIYLAFPVPSVIPKKCLHPVYDKTKWNKVGQ
jgi:hypothetical protein